MAHSKQTEKRIRQDTRRRLQNRSQKSRLKTECKKFDVLVSEGKRDEAASLLLAVQGMLDKAAKTGLYHANKSGREKSKLQRALNNLSS
jgi:small subunit ribosomal protein S20